MERIPKDMSRELAGVLSGLVTPSESVFHWSELEDTANIFLIEDENLETHLQMREIGLPAGAGRRLEFSKTGGNWELTDESEYIS
ncbi:MAG TPA: hypothetical protein VHC22_20175 [Pirellulales bacterium]|nr:hypothetical protein [Pirellulales bacterium]